MKQPMKGMELSERFFKEIAMPLLRQAFPQLSYSAGLLGFGSDVLGYDDAVSTDHMWGPRFYLFLRPEDIDQKEAIMNMFAAQLPQEFLGYTVNFSDPDPEDGGVRCAQKQEEKARVNPLIFIHTEAEYLKAYLGCETVSQLSVWDWLSLSEHKLLSLTCGRWFKDDLGIERRWGPLSYYPETVWLYRIASDWSLIAEEQAFVRRCADVGDDLGSRLVCSRIAERLMHLAFLYCRRYAPYSKWLGTAFAALPIDPQIKTAIEAATTAETVEERERQIVRAQQRMAMLHNARHITEPVSTKVETYFARAIQVIWADRVAEAVKKRLAGTVLEPLAPIGGFSELANFAALTEHPRYRRSIAAFYQTQGEIPMETIQIKYFDTEIDKIAPREGGDWIDLRAAETVRLEAGEFRLIRLGVGMILPPGYEAHVIPRSSTFIQYGIIQTNHMGLIDESYCGDEDEWKLPVYALRDTVIQKNDRICQFRIAKKQPRICFEEVGKLREKSRGGFGSTGAQ